MEWSTTGIDSKIAAMVNTLWVCDHKLVKYALEQAERLISHARANKVMHNFAWTPLYKFLHSNPLFSWSPGFMTVLHSPSGDEIFLLS